MNKQSAILLRRTILTISFFVLAFLYQLSKEIFPPSFITGFFRAIITIGIFLIVWNITKGITGTDKSKAKDEEIKTGINLNTKQHVYNTDNHQKIGEKISDDENLKQDHYLNNSEEIFYKFYYNHKKYVFIALIIWGIFLNVMFCRESPIINSSMKYANAIGYSVPGILLSIAVIPPLISYAFSKAEYKEFYSIENITIAIYIGAILRFATFISI